VSGARGRILIVSGPSGVGKSSVCARLLDSEHMVPSVSATTRPPRGNEQEGVNYFFLSREEFERRRDAGEFLEWAVVHGTLYGTPAQPVLDHLASGRHVLLDIDVQGAATLRERGLPVSSVFLRPPSMEELRRRLTHRRDTPPDEVERRMARAAEEMREAFRYDLVVTNADLDDTVRQIHEFLDRA